MARPKKTVAVKAPVKVAKKADPVVEYPDYSDDYVCEETEASPTSPVVDVVPPAQTVKDEVFMKQYEEAKKADPVRQRNKNFEWNKVLKRR
jgi:hypothetical protein